MTPVEVLRSRTLARYQLVVVSIGTTNGLAELCDEIRARTSQPILIIVRPVEEEFLLTLYQAGASECIVLTTHPSLIIAKVKSWLRRAVTNGTGKYLRPM